MLRTASFLALASLVSAAPLEVRIDPTKGLIRDGAPYFIKGAGGDTRLTELAQRGGNSIRTWSVDNLDATLAEALKNGLTVSVGLWLEPECSWFSYSKPENCAKQTERVRLSIQKYKDHPSLLSWGLGNEVEGDGKNAAFWRQLEQLALMVKAEDPAHPTFTALAGITGEKAAAMNQYCPHLDFAGINTYGALHGLRERLVSIGWTRPWVVTEFGPQGFWERPKTSWGAPLEQTSTEKAEMIEKCYSETIAPGGACLGGYAFIWAQKQEATATWFGLFTKEGETTPTVDVLQRLWSGKSPANQAPHLVSLTSAAAQAVIAPAAEFAAQVVADDPDHDPLRVRWEVVAESAGRDAQGHEKSPVPIKESLKSSDGLTAALTAPQKPGSYRLFVYVADGMGHAATANFPFRVK